LTNWSKSIWKEKTQNANTILKKNKTGILMLPGFKTL
jgi:hypothetical protein